jgi:hypothetical protein
MCAELALCNASAAIAERQSGRAGRETAARGKLARRDDLHGRAAARVLFLLDAFLALHTGLHGRRGQ